MSKIAKQMLLLLLSVKCFEQCQQLDFPLYHNLHFEHIDPIRTRWRNGVVQKQL